MEIKHLTTLEELSEAVEVQATFWDNPTELVHNTMLFALVNSGGAVIGAYHEGRLVGFILGYVGLANLKTSKPARDNLKFVSQRMAILPEYRHHGIGYRLKLAQQEYALKHDLDLITWTFDPLNSRNAHFNLRKVGAIARKYLVNYYGTYLATGGSSDRLLIEWRIKEKAQEKRKPLEEYLASSQILNPTSVNDTGFAEPPPQAEQPSEAVILIEIPPELDLMLQQSPLLVQTWRIHTRVLLSNTLQAGYTAKDFVHGMVGKRLRSFYVLFLDT